jgi:ABC-2 type transport system permease protein
VRPVPSRLGYVTAMRAASSEAAKESEKLLARYYHNHPELAAQGEQSGFLPRYFAQQRQVEERVTPVLEGFETRLAGQQALVGRLRFLSPAVIVQEAMNDVAGSSLARQQRYVAQARDYLAAWQGKLAPKIFRGENLSAADYDELPRFRFAEEPPAAFGGRVATGLAGLLVPAFVLGLWGWRRLPRYPLTE